MAFHCPTCLRKYPDINLEEIDGECEDDHTPLVNEQDKPWASSARRHNLEADNNCYTKARARNQMTFTLTEQDSTAVSTIAWWMLLNIGTAPAAKLRSALEDCLEMRKYPNKRRPD